MNWWEQEDQIPAHVPAQTLEPTGFAQNWHTAAAEMIREDLPITSRVYMGETRDRRVSQLLDYAKDGTIPQEVMDYYWSQPGGLNVDDLSMYARNELGLTDVMTPQDYEEQRDAEYADKRKAAQAVYDAQTGWGAVGEFAGRASAIPADPLYFGSFFIGYGGAATVMQAAARVAATEIAVEGVAQVAVYDWKDEIGSDYSGAEALFNVMAAGGIGGGMAAITKALSLKFGGKDPLPENLTVEDGRKIISLAPEDPVLKPARHVLDNSDPNMKLKDALAQDEARELRATRRGAREAALPNEGEAFAEKVVEMETHFDKTMELVNAKMEEIDAGRAEKGVARVTPLTEAEQKILDAGEPVLVGKPTKKKLRSLNVKKAAYEKVKAKAEAAPDVGSTAKVAKAADDAKGKGKKDVTEDAPKKEGVPQVTPFPHANVKPIKLHLEDINAIDEFLDACV